MRMEMDVAGEDGVGAMRHELKELIDSGDVVVTVLEESGPGGGNPLVAFDAFDAKAAIAVINAYWGTPDGPVAVDVFGDPTYA